MSDVATVDDAHLAGVQLPSPLIEERVANLERAVANLQDTGSLEERVADKVRSRLQSNLSDVRIQVAPSVTAPLPTPAVTRAPWLVFDLWLELRQLGKMLFDHRFHLSWFTRLLAVFTVFAILTSGWWFPLAWVPFVGTFLDKSFDLLLAFGVYRALSRETERYRQWRSGIIG